MIIENFNKRLSKISQELSLIKTKFWDLQRVEYSQSVIDFVEQQTTIEQKIKEVMASEKEYRDKMGAINLLIEEEQKKDYKHR